MPSGTPVCECLMSCRCVIWSKPVDRSRLNAAHHPYNQALALQTDEIQAERRRRNEESLQRFQGTVRHRVAVHAQVYKKRQQRTVNVTVVLSFFSGGTM